MTTPIRVLTIALLLPGAACSGGGADTEADNLTPKGGVSGSEARPAGTGADVGGSSLGGAAHGGAAPSGGRASNAETAGTTASIAGETSLGGTAGSVGGANGGGLALGGGGSGGTASSSGGTGGAPSSSGGGAGGSRASTTGGSGAGGAPSSAGAGSQALSFKTDVWPVFAKVRDPIFVYYDGSTYESCVTGGVCHGGATPGARLSMPDPETAYDQLLDAPSRSGLCNGTIRVVAGSPDRSCLIAFYETRLREELEWVDAAEIDLVRRWIAQGARP